MPSPWKQLERDTAATLGGKRHVRAHRGEPGPDVALPADVPLAIECKYRKRLPAHLRDGLAQAARPGKVAVLVLKERQQRGALAVLAPDDFARLLGLPEEGEAPCKT